MYQGCCYLLQRLETNPGLESLQVPELVRQSATDYLGVRLVGELVVNEEAEEAEAGDT